jgi:uncharacterized protein
MPYRILSLDGGGTWALIEVRALISLYSATTTGHQVLSDFDMVAANSGGSIVLGGLVEDLALGQLLAFFEDERKRRSIFSPTTSFGDTVLHDLTGLGPKYSAEAKLPALQTLLPKRGCQPLTSAAAGVRRPTTGIDVHLLITAFDYDRNRARFFRSAPTTTPAPNPASAGMGPAWGEGASAKVTLAEAIHASTNAPINYFDAPASFPDQAGRYWDGAIAGCNNPVVAAVAEALALDVPPTTLAVLSLGTGSVALPWPTAGEGGPYVQSPTDQNFVNDLRKIATSILDDPPDIASYLAHVMTGAGAGLAPPASSRVVRMNPLISPVRNAAGQWTAPAEMTAAQFAYLANLGLDAVDQNQVDYITAYALDWLAGVAPNQPIRMDGDTLTPEIGQTVFANAAKAWATIK